MGLSMWKPSLIKLSNGTDTVWLTDHNRGPVQESYEQIEKSNRTANGTLRKYVVASKKSWSSSWSMIPGFSSQTVDGYMGAHEMQSFYLSNFDTVLTLSFYSGRLVAVNGSVTYSSPNRTYTVPSGHGIIVGDIVSFVGTSATTFDITNAKVVAVGATTISVASTAGTGTAVGNMYIVTPAKGLMTAGSLPSYTSSVFIQDFSRTINKRLGDIEYWDCSMSFTEV